MMHLERTGNKSKQEQFTDSRPKQTHHRRKNSGGLRKHIRKISGTYTGWGWGQNTIHSLWSWHWHCKNKTVAGDGPMDQMKGG